MQNAECKMQNEGIVTENGKRKTENGKRKTENEMVKIGGNRMKQNFVAHPIKHRRCESYLILSNPIIVAP